MSKRAVAARGTVRVERPAERRDDPLADSIRRTIRLLGAQSSSVSDPASVVAAARFIYERLRRANVPVRWIDETSDAPLIIAGQGPIGIATYLDDSHPSAAQHSGQPPIFEAGTVRAAGIERKAGVVAAISTLLAFPERSRDLTVIVETDRHSGSEALEQWLEDKQPDLAALAWEIADLPLTPPLLVRSATGRLTMRIDVTSSRPDIERVYGAVVPDIGFGLASALSALKTDDEEVRLAGFYDNVVSPDEQDFEALMTLAPGISDWLQLVSDGESELPTSHLTLGMFCAPSVELGGLNIRDNGPYLPTNASATIEFQLMSGQSSDTILAALDAHFQNLPYTVTVTPLLIRPPCPADETLIFGDQVAILPIAPGPSPAVLFARRGIPCVGYAVVGRQISDGESSIALEAISDGSRFLTSLTESLGVPVEPDSQ